MAIQVFVVDDSAVVRQTVMAMLQGDPQIELLGSAPNPIIAEPMIAKRRPDVLLLDIEMPGVDGLTFLRQIMDRDPIPTVICSTLTATGSRMAVEALAAGAIAVIGKPRLGLKQFLEESRIELIQTLKTAARARLNGIRGSAGVGSQRLRRNTEIARNALSVNKPVAIGGSTGGIQALETILVALPADSPGIAVVQHLPERFTAMYAQRLDSNCAMRVKEAADGDRLERGTVLIAPGGRHLQLRKSGGQYFSVILDGPPVNRHKPSVDVLFKSLAECAGRDTLAIILTGMGNDGARGMRQLHDRGARTIGQDEASCVVYGMPMEAARLGSLDQQLPLSDIATAIMEFDARADRNL